MDIFEAFQNAFNGVIAFLNAILDLVEQIVRPVTDLLQRLAGLGIS